MKSKEMNVNTEKGNSNGHETNQVMVTDDNYFLAESGSEIVTPSLIDDMKNTIMSVYCSIENDGKRETQVRIYNALNNCDEPLAGQQNLILELVDIAAYPVQLFSKETGEIFEALRIIFVCKDGSMYFATSQGILNSVRKLFMCVGMPDKGAWHENPVKVKVLRKRTKSEKERYVNILELVN